VVTGIEPTASGLLDQRRSHSDNPAGPLIAVGTYTDLEIKRPCNISPSYVINFVLVKVSKSEDHVKKSTGAGHLCTT